MSWVEIERSYPWRPAEADALVAGLESLAHTVVGDDATLSGWYQSRDQPGTTVHFNAPAQEFGPLAADAGRFLLTAGDYLAPNPQVHAKRRHAEGDVQLTLRLPGERKAEAVAAISAFEAATGLASISETHEQERAGSEEDEETVSVSGRYRLDGVAATQVLDLFAAHILPFTDSERVEARLEIGPPAERTLRFQKFDRLLAGLPDEFRLLHLYTLPRRYPGSTATLDLNRESGKVDVRIETALAAEETARAAITAFEAASGLAAISVLRHEQALRGIEVVCFAIEPIGANWLDKLAGTLGSEEPHERWSSGRLELRGEPGAHTFEDADAMFAEAKARWPSVLVIELNRYGESKTIFVVVEPKLNLVRLEVRAQDESAAREALGRIEGALKLKEYMGRPYSDRRTHRVWLYPSFDRKAYAQAVRDLIDHYVSPDPIVWEKDSYVSEMDSAGNLNEERFSEVGSFVARLLDKRPFGECQIVAAGPDDRVLGFFLTADHSHLEVNSSFEAGQFDDFARVLEARLPLKPDRQREKVETRRTIWEQVRNLEGLAGRAVVGIAILLGTAFGAAGTFLTDRIIAQDTLAIVSPPAGEGGGAKVTSGCIAVVWEVRGRTLFSEGRTLLQETGMVEVYAADGRRSARFENFRSGDEMALPAGKWSIYVYDPGRQRRSETLSVNAEEGAPTIDLVLPVVCRDGTPLI